MIDPFPPLEVADCHPDPFVQFRVWFEEATGHVDEPEAMALATASATGAPSVRMVLLRHLDHESFGFFTHYESRKATELAANPQAALLFYVESLGRQVRVEGPVERLAESASDAYFAGRPRLSQLGAHASPQSHEIADRSELDALVAAADRRYQGEVPRPANWGGFRLVPDRFEFWQRREGRLHDRVLYRPQSGPRARVWERVRLAP